MRLAATAAATGPPLLLMWWKRGRRLHLQDGHGSIVLHTTALWPELSLVFQKLPPGDQVCLKICQLLRHAIISQPMGLKDFSALFKLEPSIFAFATFAVQGLRQVNSRWINFNFC